MDSQTIISGTIPNSAGYSAALSTEPFFAEATIQRTIMMAIDQEEI